jgi:hypothetical protein
VAAATTPANAAARINVTLVLPACVPRDTLSFGADPLMRLDGGERGGGDGQQHGAAADGDRVDEGWLGEGHTPRWRRTATWCGSRRRPCG